MRTKAEAFRERIVTTNPHQEKIEAAKRAINAVFSDTGVSQQTTRESLEELKDEIKSLLDVLP